VGQLGGGGGKCHVSCPSVDVIMLSRSTAALPRQAADSSAYRGRRNLPSSDRAAPIGSVNKPLVRISAGLPVLGKQGQAGKVWDWLHALTLRQEGLQLECDDAVQQTRVGH
jgi:hypothetical protein